MDRNTEAFYTGAMLNDNIQRSTWPRPFTYKGTFNTGDLVPFFCDLDVIPGMTIKNRSSYIIRMNTPKYPVMDNLYFDTYWFKIPYRTLWNHWVDFNGENENGAWTQTTEYSIPMFKTAQNHVVGIHDINCHMGLRPLSQIHEFSQMGVRAYIRTYNYWFRDQNLIAPLTMYTDDSDRTLDGTALTGGKMLKAAKFHDYFSSALPQAQKADPVTIPLATSAPVVGNGKGLGLINDTYGSAPGSAYYMIDNVAGAGSLTTRRADSAHDIGYSYPAYDNLSITNDKVIGVTPNKNMSGLVADLSQAIAATVNAQRLAFATQRIFEHDAMFGTRYLQETVGRFGVNARFDEVIPEYLGGVRIPLNIQQTIQNSSTDATSPLGFTGAFSLTSNTNEDFIKSFQEHCVVLGIGVVRADHTYQQGVARQWTRKRRLDFYWPELSHIGNQPIYNYEIYSDGSATDEQVFGYKEAWAEYKYKNSIITGELNSEYAQSLDAWHYGDDYSQLPVLSQNWIEEPSTFVDRTLLIQSATHDQFTADIFIEQEITAPMPIHCNPGLIDHF